MVQDTPEREILRLRSNFDRKLDGPSGILRDEFETRGIP